MEDDRAARRRFRSIEINVGGTIFHTTEHTLAKADDNSLLYGLTDTLTNEEDGAQQEQKKIFFDRDPSLFEALLYVLRTGQKPAPPNSSSSTDHQTLTPWFRCLESEAKFYGVTEALKSAFRPSEFNGMDFTCNHIPLPRGQTFHEPCISAVADGGFVLSLGDRLSWYDWSLNKIRTVTTPARYGIDLLAHVNSNVVVAAAHPSLPSSRSTLYVYDAGHKFHRGCIEYEDCGCESVVSGEGGRIILSMMNRKKRYGDNDKAVMEVDAETLQISRVLTAHEGHIAHVMGKGKLQWIESHRLLLGTYTVGYNHYRADRLDSCIKLFDVRAPKAEIMSCTEECRMGARTYGDVVWSEGHGKIFKLYRTCLDGDSLMHVGDLRNRLGMWGRCDPVESRITTSECCFNTSLIAHGKQLFSSSGSSLSVWDEVDDSGLCFSSNCFEWRIDFIKAIAFGGERLYVVREGANAVEVLETDYQNLS